MCLRQRLATAAGASSFGRHLGEAAAGGAADPERVEVMRDPRLTPPLRTRRIRGCLRTGALLTVIGLMRPARAVQTHWQARNRRSALERELAAYSTPAQRRDLEATLAQYPDGVTYELRDILASQAMTARNNRFPGAGRC